jgi:hypothetical protein
MRKIALFAALFLGLILGSHESSRSAAPLPDELGNLEKTYRYFIVLDPTPEGYPRYMYSDVAAHIHIYVVKKGRPELDWETATLGSAVTALFVSDVNADGKKEIMVATARGRIIVYDAQTYDRIHENFLEPFESIQCMTSANLDNDPQEEVVFIAENRLNIYDGKIATMEWRSQQDFQASEILIGNVDDDPQPEIILNTGAIIDSKFYTIEPSSIETGIFGTRIRLFDMNADGHPEILGEMPGYALKVYDVYARREIW